MTDIDELKKKVDKFYGEQKYDEIAECLEPYKDSDDVGLLWRLARANYERHRSQPSSAAKLTMLEDSLALVERAAQLDDTDPNPHKWISIYLNAITEIQGSKAKVDKAATIRHHMEKACEHGGEDATNWHLMGMWEFKVADVSWMMRNLAKVVYGELPPASFEQALQNFLKADQLAEGFSKLNAGGLGMDWPLTSRNLVMIGKCYQKLKDNENAAKYFQMVVDRDVRHAEDKEAREEAVAALKHVR